MIEPTLPKNRGAGGKSKTAAQGADAAVRMDVPQSVENAQATAQPSLDTSSPDTLTVGAQAQAAIQPETGEELARRISEAAYYRAERRGFVPGYEMEDWIEAEMELNARLDESGKADSMQLGGG